jgi:hypothetical protein
MIDGALPILSVLKPQMTCQAPRPRKSAQVLQSKDKIPLSCFADNLPTLAQNGLDPKEEPNGHLLSQIYFDRRTHYVARAFI